MLEADTINDLVVRSEERETLWKALREWADQEQSYGAQDLPEIDIDPAILASLLGLKELE